MCLPQMRVWLKRGSIDLDIGLFMKTPSFKLKRYALYSLFTSVVKIKSNLWPHYFKSSVQDTQLLKLYIMYI